MIEVNKKPIGFLPAPRTTPVLEQVSPVTPLQTSTPPNEDQLPEFFVRFYGATKVRATSHADAWRQIRNYLDQYTTMHDAQLVGVECDEHGKKIKR